MRVLSTCRSQLTVFLCVHTSKVECGCRLQNKSGNHGGGGGGIPRNGEIGHMTHEIGKEGVVGQSDRQETKEEEENQQNQL